MTLKPIGMSGFGYTTGGKRFLGGSKKGGYHWGWDCIVKNIESNENIFTITGGIRYTPYGNAFTGSKKFLGLDNKYYYIQVTNGGRVDWGQVQPSGAVLKANRTVLTTLAFYPIYKEVPEPKPVIKSVPMTPKLIAEDKEKKPWIDNLIRQIQNLINQIINLLKS